MLRRPLPVIVTALVLTAGGCVGSDALTGGKRFAEPARPTTTTSTTTTEATTTTTTEPGTATVRAYPAEYASPLNGLPADGLLLDRRAIAVKVDNHLRARPQSGIDQADAMLETIVEGGITRFIALFHVRDAAYIGPIRSLRPTDSAIVRPIEAPLAISGGQRWIQALAAQRGVRLIGESEGYFRERSRPAPHNLFSDTTAIRATADRRGWPDQRPPGLFEIAEWVIPDTPATEIQLEWNSGNVVRWEWDAAERRYTRWIGAEPHMWVHRDGTTGQVAADVLIVIEGTQYLHYPPAGQGSAVPAVETIGRADAWIFAVGTVWRGTWERASASEPFRLFELDGTPAVVPTGIPWISFFPGQGDVRYR
jgi:hypothetical protein